MKLFISRKYYLDVQRREDGFDLSGPRLPQQDPVPLRAVRNTHMKKLNYPVQSKVSQAYHTCY